MCTSARFHVLCSGCLCFVLDVPTFQQTTCGAVFLHPASTSPALAAAFSLYSMALDTAGIDGSSANGHGSYLGNDQAAGRVKSSAY